jgi:hypothetical protein
MDSVGPCTRLCARHRDQQMPQRAVQSVTKRRRYRAGNPAATSDWNANRSSNQAGSTDPPSDSLPSNWSAEPFIDPALWSRRTLVCLVVGPPVISGLALRASSSRVFRVACGEQGPLGGTAARSVGLSLIILSRWPQSRGLQPIRSHAPQCLAAALGERRHGRCRV